MLENFYHLKKLRSIGLQMSACALLPSVLGQYYYRQQNASGNSWQVSDCLIHTQVFNFLQELHLLSIV